MAIASHQHIVQAISPICTRQVSRDVIGGSHCPEAPTARKQEPTGLTLVQAAL
jgi:hypothetical protein